MAGRAGPAGPRRRHGRLFQIVVKPIAAGLVLRALLPKVVDRVQPALPWISVLAITFVVVAVVLASSEALAADI